MNLFIVESPGKVKSISSYLGSKFRVVASMGHFRDLPTNEMGVEFKTWKPIYLFTDRGKKVFSNIKSLAAKASNIYLASDDDREGEAIAWHLAVALRIPPEKVLRVKFAEISESAIKKAVANPMRLNMNLVRAQETRRVVDRLVGYMVSPAVSNSVGERLSAGRVQSVLLRLIVGRFNEHANFVSKDYYGAVLNFDGFSANWDTKPFHQLGEDYNFNRDLAQEAADVKNVSIKSVESKKSQRRPSAPLSTSTMQQAAVKQLSMDTEAAMRSAQELYEAGLITYHRTDSVDFSDEAIAIIRDYASSNKLPIPDKPNKFSSRNKNAQEAHEAIRPTDMNILEASGVSNTASRLYELIHKRALLSQLKPATVETTVATLISNDDRFAYTARGTVILDAGWLAYGKDTDSDKEDEGLLPPLTEGQNLEVLDGSVKDQKTRPPALFDEASIVAEMERLGIGRPSTYAPTIKNIKTREYIRVDKKKLVPTAVGQTLISALSGFKFLEYDFTAQIESQMDEIVEGTNNYKNVVDSVFNAVFEDMQSRFEIDGSGEDFFLPASERDYKPSEKQLAYVHKIAEALDIDVSTINLASGREVSGFMEKNINAYKLSFKPTDKQLAFAQGLAEKLGSELPDEIKSSAVQLSAWIDKNKDAAFKASMASRTPSDKQIALAEKLADSNGVELPNDYKTSMLSCSKFIDKIMGSSKKGAGRSRKKKS